MNLLKSLLDRMITNYENWGESFQPGRMNVGRLLDNGLHWQIDLWEGSEFSIRGDGIRLPFNGYMYGDAMTICRIAAMAKGCHGLTNHSIPIRGGGSTSANILSPGPAITIIPRTVILL